MAPSSLGRVHRKKIGVSFDELLNLPLSKIQRRRVLLMTLWVHRDGQFRVDGCFDTHLQEYRNPSLPIRKVAAQRP
jgi:hypothetical protein